MFAKDIMIKNVLTVSLSTTVRQCAETLVEKNISGLIVVDDNQDIIGVVTAKDLLVAYDFLNDTKVPVADFVNRDLISVTEDEDISAITKMLVQSNIKRVPVVKDKKVLGVISRTDILRYILKNNPN